MLLEGKRGRLCRAGAWGGREDVVGGVKSLASEMEELGRGTG